MISLIASLVIVAIAIMIVISQKRAVAQMRGLLRNAQDKTIDLEQKVESSRNELRKNKEELERERGALRDARELNKKKLRRQSMAEMDPQTSPSEAIMTDKALEDSQKAIVALEAQIAQLQKERNQNEDTLRANLSTELSKKEKEKSGEIEELTKKIAELQDELKKQKRLMRPEGVKVDLKTLPDEAASEFARVYRKAEQHERLHGIARAKLHLAQEKFTELQKRYFSVCRELAVLAGNSGDVEPKDARTIAEKLVSDHQGPSAQANGDESKSE